MHVPFRSSLPFFTRMYKPARFSPPSPFVLSPDPKILLEGLLSPLSSEHRTCEARISLLSWVLL